MNWTKTTDKLPERDKNQKYSQVPCLVWYKGEVKILVFNHEHMVWDDESGDDYECSIEDVSHWMPFPERPNIEPTFTGKVRFGARSKYMNESELSEWEEVSDTTDSELEFLSFEHGISATNFEHWFEKEGENE
jgi:hypothetical protein